MRISVAILFFFLSFAPLALAQTTGSSAGSVGGSGTTGSSAGQVTPSGGTTLINPLKGVDCSKGNGDCLMSFLNEILDFVISIGTIAVILMIVYVGYLFVTARGEPAQISKAREAFLWTIIGSLILLGAKAISLALEATVKALGG